MFDLDTYKHLKEQLLPLYGKEEASAMARWIMDEDPATYSLEDVLARLKNHEPMQHIFGHTYWRGLCLDVTPDTLIPRPETTELVDALRALPSPAQATPLRVLDAGTGSGCLAIALKLEHPEWEVSACDVSDAALLVARRNAERLGAKVRFFHMDILQEKPQDTFDLVVSNPPYICEEERADMEPNVLNFEPASALFVPNTDPLLFYRTISRWQSPMVAFEINERFGEEMLAMVQEEGYQHAELKQDICGKDRIVIASR